MPDFVYDLTALPSKTDRAPIPVGEDPNKWVAATDYNLVAQAAVSLRTAIRTGKFFGFAAQATVPNGTAADYLWLDSLKRLLLQLADGTSRSLPLQTSATSTTSDAAGQSKDLLAYAFAADNQAVLVGARVAACKSDASDAVGVELHGVFRRQAGVVSQVGSTNVLRVPVGAGPPSATFAIVGTTVVARVTSIAGQTWNWTSESIATAAP